MSKKIFFVGLILIFAVQTVALAKTKKQFEEVPSDKRVKIAVEVFDRTDFHDLDTDKILYSLILEKLGDTTMFEITDTKKLFGEELFGDGVKPSQVKSLGQKKSDSDVGSMIVFPPTDDNKNFNQEFYKNLGVEFVLKCNIIGIGITQSETKTALGPGFGIGIGSPHHSGFGFGIFNSFGTTIKRNAYSIATNIEMIKVEGGFNLWKRNIIGQQNKRSKPSKGYDDASDEAYLKALNKTADLIVERVANYSDRFLVERVELEKNSDDKK